MGSRRRTRPSVRSAAVGAQQQPVAGAGHLGQVVAAVAEGGRGLHAAIVANTGG